jgi:hypothetical protein
MEIHSPDLIRRALPWCAVLDTVAHRGDALRELFLYGLRVQKHQADQLG